MIFWPSLTTWRLIENISEMLEITIHGMLYIFSLGHGVFILITFESGFVLHSDIQLNWTLNGGR